jgi:hypothetical protein
MGSSQDAAVNDGQPMSASKPSRAANRGPYSARPALDPVRESPEVSSAHRSTASSSSGKVCHRALLARRCAAHTSLVYTS